MKAEIIDLGEVKVLAMPSHMLKTKDETEIFAFYTEAYMEKYPEATVEEVAAEYEKTKGWYHEKRK